MRPARSSSYQTTDKERDGSRVMILIDLHEQADRDFGRARRRASLRRLKSRLRGEPASQNALPSFDETRRSLKAFNRLRRGRRVVDLEKVVGSVGRRADFDRAFMPLRASAGERWKRVDLAFHRGVDLPPITLYRLGDAYFVEDGNHRVSVARFHGAEWIDADVTERRPGKPGNRHDTRTGEGRQRGEYGRRIRAAARGRRLSAESAVYPCPEARCKTRLV